MLMNKFQTIAEGVQRIPLASSCRYKNREEQDQVADNKIQVN